MELIPKPALIYYVYMVTYASHNKMRHIHLYKERLRGSNYLNNSNNLTLVEKNRFVSYEFLEEIVVEDKEQLIGRLQEIMLDSCCATAYEWEDNLYLCRFRDKTPTTKSATKDTLSSNIHTINDRVIRRDVAAWRESLIVNGNSFYTDRGLENLVQSEPFISSLYQWYFYTLYNSRMGRGFPLEDKEEIDFAAFEELWNQLSLMPLYINRIAQLTDAELIALGYCGTSMLLRIPFMVLC